MTAGPNLNRQEQDIYLTDKMILTTGANRGIGRVLVEEALGRGAKRGLCGHGRRTAADTPGRPGHQGLEREFKVFVPNNPANLQ